MELFLAAADKLALYEVKDNVGRDLSVNRRVLLDGDAREQVLAAVTEAVRNDSSGIPMTSSVDVEFVLVADSNDGKLSSHIEYYPYPKINVRSDTEEVGHGLLRFDAVPRSLLSSFFP